MSPKAFGRCGIERGGDIPIWTGQLSDPGLWDDFRFALQGYCGEKHLSYLMRDEVKMEDIDEGDNDTLMSILLRFTRGEAGKVVRPFAQEGDKISACHALILSHYGNECKELKQARLTECARLLDRVACRDREGISAMVIELDHLFGEFEALECPYQDTLKKLTLLCKLQQVASDIYRCIIKDAENIFRRTVCPL